MDTLSKFKAKRLFGVSYDLSHLDDSVLEFHSPTASFRVLVRYSSHCFTEAYTSQDPGAYYVHGAERRAFSLERYRSSLELPACIAALSGQTVYFTNRGNFFFLRSLEGTYVVFFDVLKARNARYDLILNVQSAHFRSGFTYRASAIKFWNVLVSKAVGATPRPGPKQIIKRK